MFREIILSVLADKAWSIGKAARLAEVNEIGLRGYLKGGTTLGLKSVESIFRTLGINVTDNGGKFYWHGYDLRTAVKRGMTEKKMLVKDMCERCGMTQPNLTEFLAGRSVSRPARVEAMLTALGLSCAVIEKPKRMPRLRTERKKKSAFGIGNAIKAALERKGITAYRFAKENGINTGGFSVYLRAGKDIGGAETERIFGLLDIHVTDGDTDYGSDIRAAVAGGMKKNGTNANALSAKLGFSNALVNLYCKGAFDMSANKLDAVFKELNLTLK